MEYWRAAPATAAAVLLLYVVVRLSVSEVKQGTACTAAYYSSYALTLLYYSLVLLCASSDIIRDIFCYQVCLFYNTANFVSNESKQSNFLHLEILKLSKGCIAKSN